MAQCESNHAASFALVELVPKSGATTAVWWWFVYKGSDVQQSAGGLTNLIHQLKQKQPGDYEESSTAAVVPNKPTN